MKYKKCDFCKSEMSLEKSEVRVDVIWNTDLHVRNPLDATAYTSRNFDLCNICFKKMTEEIKAIAEKYKGVENEQSN